jgi:hypothetical protein
MGCIFNSVGLISLVKYPAVIYMYENLEEERYSQKESQERRIRYLSPVRFSVQENIMKV